MDVLRGQLVQAVLGTLPADLPMVAAQALARGLDSPALREVAGLGRADPAEELFTEALAELGLSWPTPGQAHLYAARHLCSRLLGGAPDAARAAAAAEDVYHHLCLVAAHGEGDHDYRSFLDLAYEWDADRRAGVVPAPGRERAVVARFRELARELLAASG
ncbi:hypothetical protein ABZ249_01655 [Nocardiopsis sp. NPDC006139]|uniref:hypothetical protein n=1 Tax=Nocardiopsis TaxID=2013 RepID=UPI0033A47411